MSFKKKQPFKSRRDKRKEQRVAKKAKKHEYFSKGKKSRQFNNNDDSSFHYKQGKPYKQNGGQMKMDDDYSLSGNQANSKGKKTVKTKIQSLQDEHRREMKLFQNQTKQLEAQMQKERVKKLKEDNAAEDKEIGRLEKYLGLKKRNEKSKSNFFASDGLDYLLDVCDQNKLKDAVETEKNFKEDNDSDFGDDFSRVTGKTAKKKTKEKQKKKIQKNDESDSDDAPDELPSTKAGAAAKRKSISKDLDSDGDGDGVSMQNIKRKKLATESLDEMDEISDSDDNFGLEDYDSEDDVDSNLGSESQDMDSDDDSNHGDVQKKASHKNEVGLAGSSKAKKMTKVNKDDSGVFKLKEKTRRKKENNDAELSKSSKTTKIKKLKGVADITLEEKESSTQGRNKKKKPANELADESDEILESDGGSGLNDSDSGDDENSNLDSESLDMDFEDSDGSDDDDYQKVKQNKQVDAAGPSKNKKVVKGDKKKRKGEKEDAGPSKIAKQVIPAKEKSKVSQIKSVKGKAEADSKEIFTSARMKGEKSSSSVARKSQPKTVKNVNEEYFSNNSDSEDVSGSEGDLSGGTSNLSGDEDLSEKDEFSDGNVDKGAERKNGVWEDIYGRMRDKEGNVMDTKAYVPPHLRKEAGESSASQEKLNKLKRQLKGLLNRLAENNMVSISSQVENLYMTHSRNDMNETLWNLLSETLVMETGTPERIVAEHAMLVAVLSANIGGEVSAHCLQHAVTSWHQLWTAGAPVEDKRTNNILLLLSFMYHFKLFHCTLLYDLLALLLEKLKEKSVELLLLVLRTVGFTLRKEDPVRLKEFVIKVQGLASDTSSVDGTRVSFLLDTVLAIKNNNMNKIPNYDPEYGERIKKSLRACVRKGNYNAELKVSLEDLLKVEERGRWWVVGSAWTGVLPGEKEVVETPNTPKKSKVEEGFTNQLLDLAKKQRMNTDTRRTVFCVIMSSEDYLDAFEKLLKLGLKGPSEREIMNVLLHCLLQEKDYNPYYVHLAKRFCSCNRRFQVMLQFAVWDKIQDLPSLKGTQVTNLAKFLGFLILEKSLPLSVLKVVHFAELDKPAVRFIRQVLLAVLLAESESAMGAAFSRVAASKPLKLFREGLRLFLHHFVLRNSKAVEGTDMALLTARVKMADSALSASERNPSF